jgi:DNA repair protein RadD
MTLSPLHPHQAETLDRAKASILAGNRRLILQAATGFGKTVCAAHIVDGALRKGNPVAITVPAVALVDQTLERFVQNGLPIEHIGVMQADHPLRRPQAPIQIITPQTLARRDAPRMALVMVDEAHRRFAALERWMTEADAKTVFLGLTATPGTKGLGKFYSDLVNGPSLAWLIENKWLAPFRVFAPSKPNMEGVRTVAGDWHEGDIAERMDTNILTADIVQNWLLRGEGRPTLCFAVNKNHARHLADRFAEAGVPTAYVDDQTPREERAKIGERLGAGELRMVVNIGTLTTGVDWDVRCIVLARPTKSAMLFTQIIGRGLRTASGKDDCLVFDHTDTHERLGFVTDIHWTALDDGKPKPKQKQAQDEVEERGPPLPKCCPSCTALMPVRAKSCVSCGFEMPKPQVAAEAEGELAELRGKKPAGKPITMREVIRDMGKASVYAQLQYLRNQSRKPKSEGWVSHLYREIFDVWPKGLGIQPLTPATPELTAWVRSRQIAYAKGMAKRDQTGVAA